MSTEDIQKSMPDLFGEHALEKQETEDENKSEDEKIEHEKKELNIKPVEFYNDISSVQSVNDDVSTSNSTSIPPILDKNNSPTYSKTITSPVGSAVNTVAQHYNSLEEVGIKARINSRIFFMRNFNNWIKSMTISEYLGQLRKTEVRGIPFRVLDLGCGKGGDLLKWMKGNVSHVVCADVAEISIQHCQARYREMCNKRGYNPPFTAQFITADCTKERLRNKYHKPGSDDRIDPTLKFNLVSCQFAFHYCFESIDQADCMMRNAAECLETGGYFIGTIPNAYEIIRRHKECGSNEFGNDVYTIKMQDSCENYPLFGAMYDFHLEGVVDCPEFLVNFPTLVKLASRHNLKLIEKLSFEEVFLKYKNKYEGRQLLERVNGLEMYPPNEGDSLVGKGDDYNHAIEFLKENTRSTTVGTLSKPEWEASSLYMMFAFQKIKAPVNWDDFPEASETKHTKRRRKN